MTDTTTITLSTMNSELHSNQEVWDGLHKEQSDLWATIDCATEPSYEALKNVYERLEEIPYIIEFLFF
jgi:hypothetical protein